MAQQEGDCGTAGGGLWHSMRGTVAQQVGDCGTEYSLDGATGIVVSAHQ